MPEPAEITAQNVEDLKEDTSQSEKSEIDTSKFVSVDDFKSLKDSIESMRIRMETFGQPQPTVPITPKEDTTQQEIVSLDTKIESMNEKIDKAVYEGKGVGALLCERDHLVERKNEIRNEVKLNEIRRTGVDTLDRLSDQVVRTQMPHLNIPEIKQSYESALTQMDPSVRMNPEIRLAAYHHAVGKNMNIIVESAKQEALRVDTTQTNEISTTTSRATDAESKGGIPTPDKVLSKDNLDAITSVGKTVDEYYKSLGYKGWEDHYETNREFYEGGST